LDATLRVTFTGTLTTDRVTSTTPFTTRLTGCLQLPLAQSPAKSGDDIRATAISRIKFFIIFFLVKVNVVNLPDIFYYCP
jgi:hypothetical protein